MDDVSVTTGLMTKTALAIVLALMACKGKAKDKEPAPGTATTPSGKAAKLATPPTLGCFAWSEKANGVACVTGLKRETAEPYQVEFLGTNTTEPSVRLPDLVLQKVDEATASAVNAKLANHGFTSLAAGPSTELAAGKAHDLGGGNSLTWTKEEVAPTGDNEPPMEKSLVTAKCGGKDVQVLKTSGEGNSSKVHVRSIGKVVLVEQTIHVAREGESGVDFWPAILDTTACTAVAATW